jgi:hypothetical protein
MMGRKENRRKTSHGLTENTEIIKRRNKIDDMQFCV